MGAETDSLNGVVWRGIGVLTGTLMNQETLNPKTLNPKNLNSNNQTPKPNPEP